jgi:hypothetical protein
VEMTEEDEEESVAESEDRLLAGRRIPEAEIATMLRQAGFPASAIGQMVCTAKYESSFYERATNRNRNGSIDRGLFQINSIHLGSMRGCPSGGEALFNAATNTKCALSIYKAQGLRAWYGYRKHKSECDRYRVAGGGASTPSGGGSSTSSSSGGGCWSSTLNDMVDARTCVQSKHDRAWFQCMDGRWFRGGASGAGPYGQCSSRHAL